MDSKLYEEIGKSVDYAIKNNGSLTDQNLLYVVKVATDISSKTGADFEMLLGEGVIAMRKAEEKYDPSQNDGGFVKFCGKSVRGYMLNAVNRQGNLVHIPVNHLAGFKKGQETLEEAKIEITEIDSTDYDTLGYTENEVFENDKETILQEGLNKLDINGRIAMEMKLRLGKYSEMVMDEDGTKMIPKYKNNMQSIADELEVPINIANKIYKEAFNKLSKYCKEAYAE